MATHTKLRKNLYLRGRIIYYKFKLKGIKKPFYNTTEVIYSGKKSDIDAAEDVYREARKQAKNAKTFGLPSNRTLYELVDLAERIHYQHQDTYPQNIRAFKKHIKSFFGKDEIAAEISGQRIREFQNHLLAKGLKKNSVNKICRPLGKCFSIGVESPDFNLTKSPMKSSLVQKFSEDEFIRDRTVTKDEFFSLLAALSVLSRQVLIFDLNTGLRWIEIRRLKKTDILNIGGTWKCRVWQTKSKKWKYVTLNDFALEVIKARENIKSEYLFSYTDGEPLRPEGVFKTEFFRVVKKLGIKNLWLRDLRKSSGAELLMSTGDLKAVSLMLGHSAIGITAKMYTPYLDSHLVAQVNRMKTYAPPTERIKNCYSCVALNNGVYVFCLN